MKLIGNGVDIIEVRRIKKAMDKYGQVFLGRIFTDKELRSAKEHNSFYQHLAGRFAVKEAVFKALGNIKLGFRDVEVFNDSQGRPYCSLLKYNQNRFNIHVSISHVKNYAVASAIVTQETDNS